METKEKYQTRKEKLKAKRNNAKLYPIYKTFAWDLLCYYSVYFLFYTQVKGISAAEVLKIEAFCPIFNIILQVPVVICGDFLGRRKSLILGNSLIALHTILMIFVPGAFGIMIANFIFCFGYSLKTQEETNLLYDSVSTKGGEGLYSKLDAKGGSGYYILDGITSLLAGFLFVINNYLPMCICLAFNITSAIIAFKFKDIYTNKSEKGSIVNEIKSYKQDFKESIIAIKNSRRLRAVIMFSAVYFSLTAIIEIYRSSLLVDLGINAETFSVIIAVLTFIAGISITFQNKIHKKLKNKTYSALSLLYVMSVIIIGIVTVNWSGKNIIPIVLLMYAVHYIINSVMYVFRDKYLKNFTTPKTRSRVTFADRIISNIVNSIAMFLAGILLDYTNTSNAFLLTGLLFLALIVLTLDYMRKRFGLKPSQYKKEDIEFEQNIILEEQL